MSQRQARGGVADFCKKPIAIVASGRRARMTFHVEHDLLYFQVAAARHLDREPSSRIYPASRIAKFHASTQLHCPAPRTPCAQPQSILTQNHSNSAVA